MFNSYQNQEMEGLDKLFQYMDRYQKPVIISSHITEATRQSPVFEKLKSNGVIMYPTPERAANVVARLVEYSRYLNGA
jgi:acyl-CoA synthetase (NDP forming)